MTDLVISSKSGRGVQKVEPELPGILCSLSLLRVQYRPQNYVGILSASLLCCLFSFLFPVSSCYLMFHTLVETVFQKLPEKRLPKGKYGWKYTHSWFLLLAMASEAAITTELAVLNNRSEGNTELGSHESLFTACVSTHQCLTLFYVCFCLKK